MPPGDNRCLLYSASMILGVKPTDLALSVGCSGLEPIWDSFPNNRGHHVQEIVFAALALGWAAIYFELQPELVKGSQRIDLRSDAALRALKQFPAVLLSDTHAVAWDTQMIYDPKGRIYPIDLRSFQAGLLFLKSENQFS